MSQEVRTAKASTRSKYDPAAVFQASRASLRNRPHAKSTPDGHCKCAEYSFVSSMLLVAVKHNFRTHERQPPKAYENTHP